MKLSEIFFEAYKTVKNPPLDGVNPHFKSRYATLPATYDCIKKALDGHGVIYRQTPTINDVTDEYYLQSSIQNSAGETYEISQFPIHVNSNPQALGSYLTYAKRQQASLDWGIIGEDDDDANQATHYVKKDKEDAANNEKYIKRVNEIIKEATDAGIKREGIESWIQTKFGRDVSKLKGDEFKECADYIKGLIRDKETLKKD